MHLQNYVLLSFSYGYFTIEKYLKKKAVVISAYNSVCQFSAACMPFVLMSSDADIWISIYGEHLAKQSHKHQSAFPN